ncbi:hypothetical protein GCM10007216_18690 [Thalassobacillus devorans]|uniref:Uncharacterized protein n=1 Tax=Thalassobacillus devorans TaxID=279813 RepID=A0ABQ1NZY9_9BACI|nr:hypothetical protein [Thalassobacillus devorans]NIK28188.1 uncharacterized membrane protein HdeD (DUF308 family) [Thalassobacillus devorans]GGC88208.1 hypothetical protein GCM10007216_18690 [Thalassobacillus devorans]
MSEKKLFKGYDHSEEEVDLYVRLDKVSENNSKWKYIFLVALCITIVILYFWKPEWIEMLQVMKLLLPIIIALIIHVCLAFLIHWMPFKRIRMIDKELPTDNDDKRKNKVEKWSSINWMGIALSYKNEGNLLNKLKLIFMYLLSIDYYFARLFKDAIKKRHKECSHKEKGKCKKNYYDQICFHEWYSIKIMNKYFIQSSNWNNVVCASLLAMILAILIMTSPSETTLNVLLWLVGFRIISRFVEISYAFYNDVVSVSDKIFRKKEDNNYGIYIHRWKNSLLLKNARISLAVFSLVEVMVLYSLFYYLLPPYIIELPLKNDTLLNFVFYSISVSLMNISFSAKFHTFLGAVHVSQVFLSIILIVLSIASYMGLNNKLSSKEEEFYLKTHTKKMEIQKNKKRC